MLLIEMGNIKKRGVGNETGYLPIAVAIRITTTTTTTTTTTIRSTVSHGCHVAAVRIKECSGMIEAILTSMSRKQRLI